MNARRAGGDGRVRIGVVGCGVVATAYYLPCIRRMPDAELTAVCDTNPRRTAACARLFGAREQYGDGFEMIAKAPVDLVLILTGPGMHARFALAAARAGKHLLLQKPMALTLADATAIAEAVRAAGVKALIEPSDHTPLDPDYVLLRSVLDRGVLGRPHFFAMMPGAPVGPHPSLGNNPYGASAFFTADSGGFLFDFPYAPSRFVTLLGPCRSVNALATIAVPKVRIVPDRAYDEFLEGVTDPDHANYWDVVLNLPRTEEVEVGAPDNVLCTYEMDSGYIGVFHATRVLNPAPAGAPGGGFAVYGTDGNLVMDRGGHWATIYTKHPHLLPRVDADGGWHHDRTYDRSKPVAWPKPPEGGFNYYHVSTRHIVDCILRDRDPLVNVEWGRHITEMMSGAMESVRTGRRYEMTTTLTGLR